MDRQPPFFWSSAARTDTGKIRKHNEDAYLELPQRGLWAVADGMGGHEAGEVASAAIVETLKDLPPLLNLPGLVDEVEDRLLLCNAKLRALAASRGRNQIIGSTVVILAIYDKFAVYLWAGDSRIYRYRRGELRQLTQDHTQVEEMVCSGLLTREAARGHPNANVVTRAVGARDVLFVDLDVEPIELGDRFLLCSDGLDKELDDKEICHIMAEGDDNDTVNALINLALSRRGRDNITVVITTARAVTNNQFTE